MIGADDDALVLSGGWSLQGLEKSNNCRATSKICPGWPAILYRFMLWASNPSVFMLTMQISEKASQERSGCGIGGSSAGCSSLGGASGAERSVDRPRSSPSQRLMSTHHHHHHLGYSLLPAQYNLPYATGECFCRGV